MKIAYLGSRGFPGFNAGVEKSLEEICPRLANRGHEITLYCSDQVATTEEIYKNIHLKRTPAFSSKHFETISRTFLSAWDSLFEDFDIVHFHSIGPALLSWITRVHPCKTVVTVHGLDWQRAKWGAAAKTTLRLGEWSSISFPHKTVVVSKFLKRYFKDRYKKETSFIPNGVNPAQQVRAQLTKEKWGLQPKGYILFVSRLVEEKECHTLIKAFKKIKTDKRLVIAGSSWHSDQYVESLKKMASDDPRILFTGWAEGQILDELYSNAFLYCLPSKIEGLSLALLEAMSFGLCPLISDIPENLDVVEKNGISFQTGNPNDLAKNLEELIENQNETALLGEKAREAVLRDYSWDRNCQDLESTYLELLSAS